MTLAERKRLYLLMTAARKLAWLKHFDEARVAVQGADGKHYAEFAGHYPTYLREARARYDGMTPERFGALYERRKTYCREEMAPRQAEAGALLLEVQRALRQEALAMMSLTRKEMKEPLARAYFDRALFDTGVPTSPEEPAEACSLEVPKLSEEQFRRLDAYLLQIARQEAHLEVLEEVRHHLNGYDVYEARPRQQKGSVAAVAQELLARYPSMANRELIALGVQEYRVEGRPHYEEDERRYRKTLSESLRRLRGARGGSRQR